MKIIVLLLFTHALHSQVYLGVTDLRDSIKTEELPDIYSKPYDDTLPTGLVDHYIIYYAYNNNGTYTVPLTYPLGDPHYYAVIRVFKYCPVGTYCDCDRVFLIDHVSNGAQENKVTQVLCRIGVPMEGELIKEGCFEDIPHNWVQKAKAYKP